MNLSPTSTRRDGPLDLMYEVHHLLIFSHGHRYFVLFVDDYSKFTQLFPISRKYEVVDVFLRFQKFVDFNLIVNLSLISLIGVVNIERSLLIFINEALLIILHVHILMSKMILLSIKYVMSLKRVSLCLLMPPYLIVFETMVFLINCLPSPVLKNKSLFEILFKTILDYKFLKVFRCAAYPFNRPYNKHNSYHVILNQSFYIRVVISLMIRWQLFYRITKDIFKILLLLFRGYLMTISIWVHCDKYDDYHLKISL